MTFVQVVLARNGKVQSGAEIRDNAIQQALSLVAHCQRLTVAPHPAQDGSTAPAPTVVGLDAGSVAGLVRTIGALRPSLAVVEGQHLLQAITALRGAFPSLRIIVDFHNIESRLDLDIRLGTVPAALRPVAKMLQRRHYRSAVAADIDAARIAGEVWTCSARDRDALLALGFSGPVTVVPNPVPSWCAEGHAALAGGNEVLFVGHLSYAPNIRAVEDLCRRVMPRLRRLEPAAQLHVCGRAPHPGLVSQVHARGHRLTANPDDLAPIYRQATALAVPLREGGGTRIKILEAMAIGCPVVASAKAVEGLGLTPGMHYLAAESPDGFANALAGLIRDRGRAEAMVAAAAEFVRRNNGAAAVARAVRRAVESVAAGPKDGRR